MLITYPHMGTLAIVLKALFTGLGRPVLPPPPITKRTIELGTRNSPETVCLPFKVTLGNFIEALEQGADTIVTCGGVGPCRLGYYAEVQKGILKKLGYQFDMLVIEPDIMEVLRHIRSVANNKGLLDIYRAFKFAGAKMKALDRIEKDLTMLRPRQKTPGLADTLWGKAVARIDAADSIDKVNNILAEILFEIERGRLSGIKPLKVGLVGEIYVMLEPFINQDLTRLLGNMGVEVHKTMYLSDYVRGHLLRNREYAAKFEELFALAKPYLGHYVGGHGLKSIGHTIALSREGFDGIIQAYPFTCMPEVIAKNILPKVSQDKKIPVLSLVYDEQSGEAGIITRLEAFIDLLKSREYQF